MTGDVVPSPARGQVIEVTVTEAVVLGPVLGGDNGEVGGKNYPMAKKQHGLEFLRENAHLRPRSKARYIYIYIYVYLYLLSILSPVQVL